jgi:hypothetical protein
VALLSLLTHRYRITLLAPLTRSHSSLPVVGNWHWQQAICLSPPRHISACRRQAAAPHIPRCAGNQACVPQPLLYIATWHIHPWSKTSGTIAARIHCSHGPSCPEQQQKSLRGGGGMCHFKGEPTPPEASPTLLATPAHALLFATQCTDQWWTPGQCSKESTSPTPWPRNHHAIAA